MWFSWAACEYSDHLVGLITLAHYVIHFTFLKEKKMSEHTHKITQVIIYEITNLLLQLVYCINPI